MTLTEEIWGASVFAKKARIPKIGDADRAAIVDENIVQFDVAMNDAHSIMQILEASSDLTKYRAHDVSF
jgi:hypothetical protein